MNEICPHKPCDLVKHQELVKRFRGAYSILVYEDPNGARSKKAKDYTTFKKPVINHVSKLESAPVWETLVIRNPDVDETNAAYTPETRLAIKKSVPPTKILTTPIYTYCPYRTK